MNENVTVRRHAVVRPTLLDDRPVARRHCWHWRWLVLCSPVYCVHTTLIFCPWQWC